MGNTVIISARITNELDDKILKAIELKKMNKSDLLIVALVEYFQKHNI